MAQTFLFSNQMVRWNIALFSNIVTRLLYLGMIYRSHNRTTCLYPWCNWNSRTWYETWPFQRSLLSCWGHVSKRNIGCTRNNVWFVSKTWESIKRLFHFPAWYIFSLLQQLFWIGQMGLKYDASEYILFTDSSNRKSNAVFLHNENSFSPTSIGHSVQMKEPHNKTDHLLLNTRGTNGWCMDPKLLHKVSLFSVPFGHRADDQDYIRQEWPIRQGLKLSLD